MLKYIETTGKTEEAAVEAALAQLGLERDDVSVEILERAKTGFLGIGSAPARVKVSYEAAEEPKQPAMEVTAPAAEPAPVKQPTPPVREETAPGEEREEPETLPMDEDVKQAIESFLQGLLHHMFVEAEIRMSLSEEGICEVELVGQDLGCIIGRRGETLDAIQQLTNYSVNRGRAKRVRIHVDAEHYRAKREEALIRLANKVAGKVLKYRRNVTLEPMNAYERHVIHTALQNVSGVTTYSVGTEPNRRTVVAYDR